jgi:hypothetical protein
MWMKKTGGCGINVTSAGPLIFFRPAAWESQACGLFATGLWLQFRTFRFGGRLHISFFLPVFFFA